MTVFPDNIAWYRGFHEFLLNTPAYKDFAGLFGGAGVLDVSNNDLLKLEYKAMGFMHRQLDKVGRERLSQAIAGYVSQGGVNIPAMQPENEAELESLNLQGWTPLPEIEGSTVRSILSHFQNSPLVPWDDLSKPAYSTAEKLRKTENLAIVPNEFLFTNPEVMALGYADDALSIAANHLQAPALLLGASAWTSFAPKAGEEKLPFEAQKFHLDLDDYRFVKQFIYLTDVDETSGPHEYVPGTHDPENIVAARDRCRDEGLLSEVEFDEWYFRKLRKEDDEVLAYLGVEPIAISGKSGSRMMVNTEGIHKGRVPTSNDRWILQFLYGVSASIQFDISDLTLTRTKINSKLDPKLARYCDYFVNTL